ncbi:MAG: hypothetical protein ACK4J1_14000 [Hylemonella sp.]
MALPPVARKRSGSNVGVVLLAAALLGGCASWLPEARTDTTPFQSYEEARTALLALQPMKSDRHQLEANGFFPGKHPNTTVLTHADVVRRFVPGSLLRREDLDPGVVTCLEARDACSGVEITGAKILRARRGSFWADFFNFQRRTETTGWRFTALVLLVNDTVVYRAWSGQPAINEVEVARNPLGPFQDIGPPAATSAAPIK